MHRPGATEDLAAPVELWARAATQALVGSLEDGGRDFGLEQGPGLRCDNPGGSYWWRLSTFPGEGRALLSGQDSDGSRTHLVEPPVDLLAGGPDWLPWDRLRSEAEDYVLGYVYWWQDGAWSRAPYPDDLKDDGLEMSVPWVAPGDAGVRALAARLESMTDAEEDPLEAVIRFLGAVRDGAVDEASLAAVADALWPEDHPHEPDTAAATAFARELGVAAAAGR